MSHFEPYRPRLDDSDRSPIVSDLVIRAATLRDVPELAVIQAERDGGDPAEHLTRLETRIISNNATGNGHVLVAQHMQRLVGLAKVAHFAPAHDSPANVAPPGWYLSGVIIVPDYRRRGIGSRLTQARLSWIGERDRTAYYFANIRNDASIEMHRSLGFVEVTRDFTFPGATFEGGVGVLFMKDLRGILI